MGVQTTGVLFNCIREYKLDQKCQGMTQRMLSCTMMLCTATQHLRHQHTHTQGDHTLKKLVTELG